MNRGAQGPSPRIPKLDLGRKSLCRDAEVFLQHAKGIQTNRGIPEQSMWLSFSRQRFPDLNLSTEGSEDHFVRSCDLKDLRGEDGEGQDSELPTAWDVPDSESLILSNRDYSSRTAIPPFRAPTGVD